MAIPPLILRIYADSRGVHAGVSQAVGRLNKFKAAAAAAGKIAAVAIGVAAVAGIKKSIDAAREAAVANLKLRNSIANSATVTKDAVGAFTAQADAIRDLTGVDDEAVIGAQAFLVQMKLSEEQVKTLTPLIVDLSSKMGIDLETAAKAVGKSVNGTTGSLARMGVVVDKTKAQTDPYLATVEALGVAQGFAAKQARVEPWKKVGAQFEELAEGLGNVLLPIIRTVFNWINDKAIPWLRDMANTLREKLGPPLAKFWQALRNDLWPALKKIWEIIQPVVKVLGGAFVFTLGRVVDALVLVINAVQTLIDGLERVLDLLAKFSTAKGAAEVTANIPGTPSGNPFNPYGPLPGSQKGGYVSAGMPRLIGEAGPEIFVPRVAGTIIPNDNLGGDTTIIVKLGEETVARIVEKGLNRAAARH